MIWSCIWIALLAIEYERSESIMSTIVPARSTSEPSSDPCSMRAPAARPTGPLAALGRK